LQILVGGGIADLGSDLDSRGTGIEAGDSSKSECSFRHDGLTVPA